MFIVGVLSNEFATEGFGEDGLGKFVDIGSCFVVASFRSAILNLKRASTQRTISLCSSISGIGNNKEFPL